jgi:hypothetical protein
MRRRLTFFAKFAAVICGLAAAAWLVWQPPSFVSARLGNAPLPSAESRPTIEFDHFSTRHERSSEGSRLTVSMRMRTNAEDGLSCYLFIVASNERGSPKTWAIWPPEANGLVVTASGHFHGASPTTGRAITLTTGWQRITATLPDPINGASFDLVEVYVVGEAGGVLLSRPFRI